MNKVFSILGLFILFTIFTITSQISNDCGSGTTPTKADDCKDDTLTTTQKDNDYVHCCYFQFEKNVGDNECKALTSNQYKNIGNFIKFSEEQSIYAYKIKIDCQSSNLHLFLFTLIIQLILL